MDQPAQQPFRLYPGVGYVVREHEMPHLFQGPRGPGRMVLLQGGRLSRHQRGGNARHGDIEVWTSVTSTDGAQL